MNYKSTLSSPATSLSGTGLPDSKWNIRQLNTGLTGSGLVEVIPERDWEETINNQNQIFYALSGAGKLTISDILSINEKTEKNSVSVSGIKQFIHKIKLNSLFSEELSQYFHYVQDSGDVIFTKTDKAIEQISSLNYESASLELTPDKTIIFSLRFRENKNLHIELYFHPKGEDSKEAFFALYQNKRCLENGMGTIEQVVSQNKKILTR
jgi:hypothetical protein